MTMLGWNTDLREVVAGQNWECRVAAPIGTIMQVMPGQEINPNGLPRVYRYLLRIRSFSSAGFFKVMLVWSWKVSQLIRCMYMTIHRSIPVQPCNGQFLCQEINGSILIRTTKGFSASILEDRIWAMLH